jgi:uridylate kinase
MSRLYVLSLGGSLIVPNELDHAFLKNFYTFIAAQTKRGNRFIIVIGGGQTCRKYQDALRFVGTPPPDDLDWMGIEATWLNAKLIQLMLGKLAYPAIIRDPNKKVLFREKVLVAGGWKPGRSSDDDAVRLAAVYGARTIINLSNIDYVYDKDPHKFKGARKIEVVSWKDYSRMFFPRWNPGAHVPFDPVAARFARAHKQKVVIANGKDLKNLARILAQLKFKGTVIS